MIKPNHHYSVHVAPSARDFGPLHTFWTFLFERINKVLKSYNSANHSGGELEVSFFREFHRTVQQSRVVSKIVWNSLTFNHVGLDGEDSFRTFSRLSGVSKHPSHV